MRLSFEKGNWAMMMAKAQRLCAGLLMAGLVGCGSGAGRLTVVPVEGVVSVNGEPVVGANVSFMPETPAQGMLSAAGTSDAQGKFKLSAGSYVGLPAGKYKVAVTHYTMKDGSPIKSDNPMMDVNQLIAAGKAKQAIPRKYSDMESTQLRMEVAVGKTTGYDIVMDKK